MGESQAGTIRQSAYTPNREGKRAFIREHWDAFPLHECHALSIVGKAREAGLYRPGSSGQTVIMGLNNEYERMKKER